MKTAQDISGTVPTEREWTGTYRDLVAKFPSVARAASPVQLPPAFRKPIRSERGFSYFENYFWGSTVRNYQMRRVGDTSAVFGPMQARGWCLNPLVVDGDLMWFDPTLPARAGDIVIFQTPRDESVAQLHRFQSKLLVEFGEEYWMSCRDGMFPVADIKILGVMVRHSHSSDAE